MSKAVKAMITDDLKGRFDGAVSACVVELTGLDVTAQEKIRRELRSKTAKLQVVKNSLARRAFQGSPLAPLGEALVGPCALVTSPESMIEVAKYLMEAAKEFKSLKLKGALYEGDPALITVEALSKYRSKRELVGDIAMLVGSPGRSIAGCLSSPQSRIAGCLKTLADKAA